MKFNEPTAAKILQEYQEGKTISDITKEFGLDYHSVRYFVLHQNPTKKETNRPSTRVKLRFNLEPVEGEFKYPSDKRKEIYAKFNLILIDSNEHQGAEEDVVYGYQTWLYKMLKANPWLQEIQENEKN